MCVCVCACVYVRVCVKLQDKSVCMHMWGIGQCSVHVCILGSMSLCIYVYVCMPEFVGTATQYCVVGMSSA